MSKNNVKGVEFFKPSMKNLYKMLSFMGIYDIHKLKERNPKLYKEIMEGK